jgi:putative transposase
MYFETICTQGHRCYFGEVEDGRMVLSKSGQIANRFWREIPMHHDHVVLDAFVVMPNHVHGIIFITDYGDLEKENVETLHATSLRVNQLSEIEFFGAISPI